jgi:glycosyltransferase involved in cell wall biosynthesis
VKPRVLFVSRERIRLPLAGAQKRKWDALSDELDYRVVAAAPQGSPTRDEHMRLVSPQRPQALDGAAYYVLLPHRVARELRAFEPDVLFVQGVHEAFACRVALRLARSRAKLVLDIQGDWRGTTRLYGSPARRLLNPLNDAMGPRAVRAADGVRTISTPTTELVRAAGIEPIASFPPYVDVSAFLERPPAPLPERPGVLFVGALERVKAFDTLAAAWRLVDPQVPGASLRIVGSGSLAPLAAALVDEVSSAEWTGRLESDAVAAAMDEAWIVCLPSRSEGLGRVALEAAARGRAIVGGAGTGIADVVRDGENGALVDADDAGALAAVLLRILSNRSEAERLGSAARRTGEAWAATPSDYAKRMRAAVDAVLD